MPLTTSTVPGSNGRSRKTNLARKRASPPRDQPHEASSYSDSSRSSSRTASPNGQHHHHHPQNDRLPEFEQKYVNEDHMEAFRSAIEDTANESSAEFISAVTDFMPVQQVAAATSAPPSSSKRSRQRKSPPRRYNGYSYTLLRIPLMVSKQR